MSQPINPIWWLGLLTGILEVALGFWASQQYVGARATLLILWVGFYAIFRGIGDLVLCFRGTLRSLRPFVPSDTVLPIPITARPDRRVAPQRFVSALLVVSC